MLQAKAVYLHKQLCEARGETGPIEFVASDGLLWRFCRRHGIRQLTLQGEKLSADKPASEEFVTSFRTFVEDNNYTLNQIFAFCSTPSSCNFFFYCRDKVAMKPVRKYSCVYPCI